MSGPTRITLKNGTAKDAVLWITLGGADPKSKIPVVSDVRNLKFTPAVRLNIAQPKQASFTLAASKTVEISAPANEGLNGNLSYAFGPTQCNPEVGEPPCNGTTLFEFNLNSGTETLDISCVGGLNAKWSAKLTGGSPWSANYGKVADIKEFENKAFGHNKGQVGVYPYGCDTCTDSVGPPACITPGKDNEPPQDEPICNIQRPEGFDKPGGGEVAVCFEGAL